MVGISIEEDDTRDFDKVELIDGKPYCKEHGAMNKLNGVWRCFAEYRGNARDCYPKGIKPIKFVNRVCNAFYQDNNGN